MKRILIAFLLLFLPTLAFAQDETPSPTATPALSPTPAPNLWLQVVVDSAYMRAEPLPEAAVIGSAFEGESLQAVGRNADGTWFQARRPGSTGSGWVFNRVVQGSFDVAALPLTSTAGVEGPEPVVDTGLVVFVLSNTNLRAAPFIDADEIGLVPHSVTIPIIGRNPDASWLYVNYIGYVGWISGSQARPFGDVISAPVYYDPEQLASGDSPLNYTGEVIPPEVQLAHVYQMRDHVTPLAQMADDLARYWDILLLGEIFPCEPPPFAIEFPRSERDVQELPELGFLLPQLDRGTDHLNESVDALQECGAFEEEVIIDARNDAINAGILFNSVQRNLRGVEELIR